MKRFATILLIFAILAGSVLPGYALSEGQENILRRAQQLTEITWTAEKEVSAWNGKNNYQAGKTYKGVPYGQPVGWGYIGYEVTLEEFASAAENAQSKLYQDNPCNGAYYATDCSGFVSYAWGLSRRRYTKTLAEVATKVSGDVNALEVGDCLNLEGNHAVLVTAVEKKGDRVSSVAITEQTPPLPKTTEYTAREVEKRYLEKGYVILRYVDRDSVAYEHSCASPLMGDACSSCGAIPIPGNTNFRDMDESAWYFESVREACARGLFCGVTSERFDPEGKMSRAMFVTVLGRMAGVVETNHGMVSVTDVPRSAYYAPFIQWAYQNGISAGTGNGRFSPNEAITREEMATIIYNYVNRTEEILPETREQICFDDTESIAVTQLQQAGVLNGTGNGKFEPDVTVTRAQAATVLVRLQHVLEDEKIIKYIDM